MNADQLKGILIVIGDVFKIPPGKPVRTLDDLSPFVDNMNVTPIVVF